MKPRFKMMEEVRLSPLGRIIAKKHPRVAD